MNVDACLSHVSHVVISVLTAVTGCGLGKRDDKHLSSAVGASVGAHYCHQMADNGCSAAVPSPDKYRMLVPG